MPKFAGRHLRVWLADSADALREISGDVATVESPSEGDMHEVSGGNSTRKSYVVGLLDSTMRLNGPFNTDANRSHAVLSGLIGGTAGKRVIIAPVGSASGYPKVEGTAVLKSYNTTSDVGGAVVYAAELVPIDDTTAPSWGTFA